MIEGTEPYVFICTHGDCRTPATAKVRITVPGKPVIDTWLCDYHNDDPSCRTLEKIK